MQTLLWIQNNTDNLTTILPGESPSKTLHTNTQQECDHTTTLLAGENTLKYPSRQKSTSGNHTASTILIAGENTFKYTWQGSNRGWQSQHNQQHCQTNYRIWLPGKNFHIFLGGGGGGREMMNQWFPMCGSFWWCYHFQQAWQFWAKLIPTITIRWPQVDYFVNLM